MEREGEKKKSHSCKTLHLEVGCITWGQVTLISNIFTVGVKTYAFDECFYSCNFYFTWLLTIQFPCIITIVPFLITQWITSIKYYFSVNNNNNNDNNNKSS